MSAAVQGCLLTVFRTPFRPDDVRRAIGPRFTSLFKES